MHFLLNILLILLFTFPLFFFRYSLKNISKTFLWYFVPPGLVYKVVNRAITLFLRTSKFFSSFNVLFIILGSNALKVFFILREILLEKLHAVYSF